MRRQLANLLKQLKQELKQDWSLLLVTYDAGELLEIADSCWTIHEGTVTPDATSGEQTPSATLS